MGTLLTYSADGGQASKVPLFFLCPGYFGSTA